MTIETKKLLSMAAAVYCNARKADSYLVTDEETSQRWDELVAGKIALQAKYPGIGFDVPHDTDF